LALTHVIGRPPTKRLALAAVACLTAALIGLPGSSVVHAAPESATIDVHVSANAISVPSDGAFSVAVSSFVKVPTPYFEVRFQLRRPDGRLLFQRTEVRNNVEAGTVDVVFERTLDDLSLRPAAYPYEIRVRTETGEPREQTIEGALLVHAREPEVTPFALVVRVNPVPLFDPEGRFVSSPHETDGARQAVETLAAAVLSDPRLSVSLLMPPVVLDEWSQIADGFQIAGPAGITDVGADEAAPLQYRQSLDDLKAALATGRLELLNVPYADPDLAGLIEMRSLHDLGTHYSRAQSTVLATTETSPSAGSATSSLYASETVLDVLAGRGIEYVLLDPDSLRAHDASATPGVWSLRGSALKALAVDTVARELIASRDATAAIEHIFSRSVSSEPSVPVVAVHDAGTGSPAGIVAALDLVRAMASVPWAQPVTAAEAALAPPSGTAAPIAQHPADDAPPGYWDEVAQARRYAHALESAVGTNDPDAQAVARASLIAQSRSWAGPDGRWSLADRGRAFSATAVRQARSLLEQVSVTTRDVTLSGPRGRIPLSITNGSDKTLTVTLKLFGEGMHFGSGASERITLRPQESYHTVPVDLQSSLSGRFTVEIWASEVMLTQTTATVRASYLDRLAVIGGVALVLIGLLYFIRRKTRELGDVP